MSRGRRTILITGVFVTGMLFGPFAFAASCCRCISPDNPKASICIQQTAADCNGLEANTTNISVKNLKCVDTLTDAQCRSIVDGGVCINLPSPEKAYSPTPTVPGTVVAGTSDFQLGVSIPGLSFAPITESGGQVHVSWFAQYIAAIQKYLVGISIVVAAVAITYGGFRYLVGSAAGSVARGKEIITDAVIGLILVFGAYLILYTISPATVSPIPLDIQSIKHKNAFTDAAQERARVVAAATVKTENADVLVPVIDLDTGGKPTAPTTTPPPGGATPTAAPELKPGDVAKDNGGNLIAQGACPSDMVEIKHSDAYPFGKVAPFCMDVYEAPDQNGVKPILGINEYEAEWYCNARGKRLCNQDEWVRACTGPEGKNKYGYGPDYVVGQWTQPPAGSENPVKTNNPPAPCNYDTPIPPNVLSANIGKIFAAVGIFSIHHLSLKPEDSSINPDNPKLKDPTYKKEVDDYYQTISAFNYTELSGNRPKCTTAEGVVDMVGNAQELVVASNAKNLTTEQRIAIGLVKDNKPYTWMNFYFNPIAHKANPQATPTCTQTWGGGFHHVGERSYENGFRCCMNLAE